MSSGEQYLARKKEKFICRKMFNFEVKLMFYLSADDVLTRWSVKDENVDDMVADLCRQATQPEVYMMENIMGHAGEI